MIRWTVVIDDGTRPYGPDIQIDQRRPLRLVAGSDETIEISLINPVGGVVIVDAPGFLQLNCRSRGIPQRQAISRRSVQSGQKHTIAITADDTKAVQPMRGEFDLWAIRSAQHTALIPLSEFVLAPGALGKNYL